MASSLQGTIVAGSSARQPCYFLERLPLELRQQIYGYLLGAKCTKHEHDMNSVEYNNQRNQLMIGPDHYYEFQPAVLALNHQIRMEAGELFRRGNTFIRLVMFPNITTSTRDYLRDYSDIEDGLAIIARGNTTRHFPDIAMTLAFDDQPDVAGSGKPLRQLHNFEDVEIMGVRSERYKQSIRADICSRSASVHKVIEQGCQLFDRGLDLQDEEQWQSAMDVFKSCLQLIRNTIFDDWGVSQWEDDWDSDEVIEVGYYSGCLPGRARDDLDVQLLARIAYNYFKMKKYRMARIYVERAYGPRHGYDDQGNGEKLPLWLHSHQGAFQESYAEVLSIAAQISYFHGRKRDALEEIEEALKLNSNNAQYYTQFEDYSKETNKEKRRVEGGQQLKERIIQKCRERVKIAEYRERKADAASCAGHISSARATYESALSKLETTTILEVEFGSLPRRVRCGSGDIIFGPCGLIDPTTARIQSKLAAVCLELGAFDEVCLWADRATEILKSVLEGYEVSLGRAYFCKAIAWEKTGEMYQAIETMHKAVECDPEDAASCCKLAEMEGRWCVE